MTDPAPTFRSHRAILRIVIAEDNLDSCRLYEMMLTRLGHEVIGVAHDGETLFQLTAQLQPDLIIADVGMPTLDGVSATGNLWKREPLPMVLISGQYSEQLRERAQLTHVMVYLQKPVTIEMLAESLHLAQAYFDQYLQVRSEARNPRTVEDDWRNVYQAKQMLMKSAGMDEQGAFQRLQELAVHANRRIAQAARTVVAVQTLADNNQQARAGQGGTT